MKNGVQEYRGGVRSEQWSGEILRYVEEHRWRKRLSRLLLTLRVEIVGSEQDWIPE